MRWIEPVVDLHSVRSQRLDHRGSSYTSVSIFIAKSTVSYLSNSVRLGLIGRITQ